MCDIENSSQQELRNKSRRKFLLGLATVISILLFLVVQQYVVSLILAAVFATITTPAYNYFLKHIKDKKSMSAVITVLLTIIIVFAPVLAFLGVLVDEAIKISETAANWAQTNLADREKVDAMLEGIPYGDILMQQRETIMRKLGEVVGRVGSMIANGVSGSIRGGVVFFIQAFVMLYGMYFFLIYGRALANDVKESLPLSEEDSNSLIKTFTSVSRATLKGSIVIGIVQGALAGIAYYFAGVEGPVFWATVTALFSIVPGVGAPIVWIPIVIYLYTSGHGTAAIGVALWCALIVGTSDNILRPKLVGRDTQMPDILVLITTLGGIGYFGGIAGIVIGPLIGALFLTAWKLWANASKQSPDTN